MVQCLRLRAPKAEGLSLIPGQGTRSHMLQLRVCMAQLKILCAATKTQHNQINSLNKINHRTYCIAQGITFVIL